MRVATRTFGKKVENHDHGVVPMQERELERIVAEYLGPVYRFLYSRLGNREDAEDLTSQVFLKASQQLDGARTDASIASWLFTVSRTVLADHWRQYYRAPAPLELDDDIAADRPYDESGSSTPHATEQLVEEVLQALPTRYRRVLELRFLQGYSVEEAAKEMGVTPGNLKVLQHRALARAAGGGFPPRVEEGACGSSLVEGEGAARTAHDRTRHELACCH